MSSLTIFLSHMVLILYLIPHVSYTFLSTVAVHPLDVTREISVEFAQVADLVVEGAYYSYHELAFSYFV